jgi:hypothetical protein
MNLYQLVPARFCLLSVSAINEHSRKNKDSLLETTSNGAIIRIFHLIISFLIITLSFKKTLNIEWYWSLLLSLISNFVFANLFYGIYLPFFGYKSKPRISIQLGIVERVNLHYIDAIITLIIAIILFIIF